MKCTWKDCKKEATKKKFYKNGKQWGNLCEIHNNGFKIDMQSLDIYLMLKTWKLAAGKKARKELKY